MGGVEVWVRSFLTSELDCSEFSVLSYTVLTPDAVLLTYWVGGRVNPRVGLDVSEWRKCLVYAGNPTMFLRCPASSLHGKNCAVADPLGVHVSR